MNTELAPIVGDWYRHLDKGQLFCVVAVDEDAGVVEMQHFDGDLEEVELAPWYEMTLEPAEAPEDWTGPADDIEPDDLPYTETDMAPSDWARDLQDLRGPDEERWQDPTPEDERDDRAGSLPAGRPWQEDIEGAALDREEVGDEEEE